MQKVDYTDIWGLRKEVLINSFVYANFNYCPLKWHFDQSSLLGKLEKYKQGHLKFCTMILIAILSKLGKCTVEVKHLRIL